MVESEAEGGPGVRQQAVRGTLWLGGSRAITQVVTWLITLFVVRLLSPSEYGLFGFATLVTGIADLIAELGLGAAIIQKRDLDSDAFDTIFWMSMVTGTLIYGLTWLSAPGISLFFNQGRLTDVLRLTMLTFVINSARVVPWNLLTKRIDFASRSMAEVAATLSSSGATLVLAYLGFGVWSLVCGSLCRSLVLTVLCILIEPWRPRWRFSTVQLAGIMRFGAAVSSARITWYFNSNADFLIVGKLLGGQVLGLYSLVMQLAVLPADRITSIINQVGFSVYSRLQHEPDRFARYFLETLTLTSLVTFPIMTGLAATADLGVLLLLPPRWHPVAAPLQLMCVVGMVMSVSTLVAPAVLAKGRPDLALRFNLLCLAVMPVGFYAGAMFGLIGVCWAWLLLFPVAAAVWFHMTRTLLSCTWKDLVVTLLPATTSSVLMLGLVLLLRWLAASLEPQWLLPLLVAIGIVGYVAALQWCFPGRIASTRNLLRLRSSASRFGLP